MAMSESPTPQGECGNIEVQQPATLKIGEGEATSGSDPGVSTGGEPITD